MPKKKSYAFNPTQIKDGRIVRLRKDGSIKADLGPYIQGVKKNIYNGNRTVNTSSTI
jgi:hypothetical protein